MVRKNRLVTDLLREIKNTRSRFLSLLVLSALAVCFLAGLRALKGKIPQIREQEVGVSCVPGGYDAVLTSVFDSLEDLELYKKDPRHVEVSEKCKAIRTSRAAVDYEV